MDTYAGPPPLERGSSPYEGIPFRGPQMNIREDDPPHLQPKINHVPHIQTFDLADEDDVKKYLEVLHSITRGECVLSHEDIRFVAKTGSWKTIVRWYDQFLTAPDVEVRANGKTVWTGNGRS